MRPITVVARQLLCGVFTAGCIGTMMTPVAAFAQRSPGPTELPLTFSGKPTKAAISAADLMTRLYIFAADSMLGRRAASESNRKGTTYIEREIRRMGLLPGGDDGTYLQSPILLRDVDSTSWLRVGERRFMLWSDFAPRDQGTGAREFDGSVAVFGGTTKDSIARIPISSAEGRIVVLALGKDSLGAPDWDGVNRAVLSARFAGARAIAVAQLDAVPAGYVDGAYRGEYAIVRGTVPSLARPNYFYVTNNVAEQMLGVRLDDASPGAIGRTVRGKISFTERRAPARNVIGILPGSDARLRGEYVALGAHNDHIGRPDERDGSPAVDHDSVRAFNIIVRPRGGESPRRPASGDEVQRIRRLTDSLRARHGGSRRDSIFNGADDDGSGTVTLLEIAEAFAAAKVKPSRSLLFVWHTGEELGMFGSQYFTDHPTVARDSIVAQLNVDMVGRGTAADVTGVTKDGAPIRGGPGYLQVIGSRRMSSEFGELVAQVNVQSGLRLDYTTDVIGHPQTPYCRSDHFMYARYGIPVAFFTTGVHADYHQVTDEPQYINYDGMAKVARFIYAVADRVGRLDHRPRVDIAPTQANSECPR